MNIKIFKGFITLCFLTCSPVYCMSADMMYTQNLSSGNNDNTSNSSATYTNKEFPNYNPVPNQSPNTDPVVVQPVIINPNSYYYPQYYYNRYPTYRIGPYYSSGISIGGFNYKGFGYNYSSSRRPIYINHPVPPPPPPYYGNMHKPHNPHYNMHNRPPQRPHQGGNHGRPPHQRIH